MGRKRNPGNETNVSKFAVSFDTQEEEKALVALLREKYNEPKKPIKYLIARLVRETL